MSVIEWIIEGSVLVLILFSWWLHLKANKIANEVRETNAKTSAIVDSLAPVADMIIEKIPSWSDKIDENMEHSWGEHIFHAFFNVLVSLGAGEMAKGDKAKQTMALQGFAAMGEALGRGLKKEIPAVEYANKYLGDGQPQGFDPSGLIGQIFGIDLPPGLLRAPPPKPQMTEKTDSGIAGQ